MPRRVRICNFYLSIYTDSPIFTPYPDLEANNIHSPDGLVSIFRVRIDACDRMWGLDTGLSDILGAAKVVQPMRLVVIDLKTNKVSLLFIYVVLLHPCLVDDSRSLRNLDFRSSKRVLES